MLKRMIQKRLEMEQRLVALTIKTQAMAAQIAQLQLDVHTLKAQRMIEESFNVQGNHTR